MTILKIINLKEGNSIPKRNKLKKGNSENKDPKKDNSERTNLKKDECEKG